MQRRKIMLTLLVLAMMLGTVNGCRNVIGGFIFDPLPPAPTPDPPTQYTMKCSGYVKDSHTQNGLEGASVILEHSTDTSLSVTTTTSSSGYYTVEIRSTKSTNFVLTVSKNGFETEEKTYASAITTTANIYLDQENLDVEIRNIGDNELILFGTTIDVIVKCTGSTDKVYMSFAGGLRTEMEQYLTTNYYSCSLDITTPNGYYILKVYILDYQDNVLAYEQKVIHVINYYRMKLYYEIDVVDGVEDPSSDMLSYVRNYWASRAISVTFKIDDTGIDCSSEPTTAEVFSIEENYNNHEFLNYGTTDDRRTVISPEYPRDVTNSQEKWILWGSGKYNGQSGAVVLSQTTEIFENVLSDESDDVMEIISGNYIYFGADYTLDTNYKYGYVLATLMHEIGHSIGIGQKVKVTDNNGASYDWVEDYDGDQYSVMAYSLDFPSCYKFTNHWFYSYEYWQMIDDIYN